MKSLLLQSLIALAFAAFAYIANATTIHVPADQATIQAGVNTAANNDTVLVEEGIYHENVVVKNKDIVLASRYILDSNIDHILYTIIDGSTPIHADTGSCVILYGGTSPMVMGFTLTKGNGTNWFDISDSKTYREGGGVLTENNTARIYNNLIVNNKANQIDPGVTSSGGGGIRVGFGSAEIVDNVIAFNEGRYGAGVVVFNGTANILNNVVYKNKGGSGFGGAGLWLVASTSVTVDNNTIMYNASTTSGGGLLVGSPSTFIRSNIIRGNTAVSGQQLTITGGGAGSLVSYSNVQGGFAGVSNTSEDPLFDVQNFLLTVASPCVDSGDPNMLMNDIEDGGNPGFAFYPSLGTLRNDKGAYGGPQAIPFPRFTSPDVSLGTTSINFGTIDEDDTATAYITLNKSAYGILVIDSVRFPGNPGSHLSSPTPDTIDVAFTDSIKILWTPPNGDTIVDTAYIYHNDTSVVSPLKVPVVGIANGVSCCHIRRGNANGDAMDQVNILDLNFLVARFFNGGPAPVCLQEANVNGDVGEALNVLDLNYLVNFVFNGGAPPPTCP